MRECIKKKKKKSETATLFTQCLRIDCKIAIHLIVWFTCEKTLHMFFTFYFIAFLESRNLRTHAHHIMPLTKRATDRTIRCCLLDCKYILYLIHCISTKVTTLKLQKWKWKGWNNSFSTLIDYKFVSVGWDVCTPHLLNFTHLLSNCTYIVVCFWCLHSKSKVGKLVTQTRLL